MATPSNARFSTYSGAPSLQASLAPTYDTNPSARSSRTQATDTYLTEKAARDSSPIYPNSHPSAQTSSTATLSASADPKAADIKSYSGALDRMQDERLERQRYVMSGNKSEEVSKLALGAKVERALARRMVGQDASFTTTPKEKRNAAEIRAR